jgi:hypothetical protein
MKNRAGKKRTSDRNDIDLIFNNLIFSFMFKVRFNLRRVAAIVACLAVTTMFASCDKGDSDDGGGNIDPKLIGFWVYESTYIGGGYGINYAYSFTKDGSCSYLVRTSPTIGTTWEGGEFYTSDGKIYMTGLYYLNHLTQEKTYFGDKVVEYSIGTDDKGTYLTAATLGPYESYYENNPLMKFYK